MFLRVIDRSLPVTSNFQHVEARFDVQSFDLFGDMPSIVDADPVFLIFDLKVNTDAKRRAVEGVIRRFPDTPAVAIIDVKSKLERVFWNANGVSALIHKTEKPDLIVKNIERVLEEHIRATALSPGGIERAVKVCDTALAGMAESVAKRSFVKDQSVGAAALHVSTLIDLGREKEWLAQVQQHHSQTFQHSLLVASVISAFAKHLALPRSDQAFLTKAALLHDIGKMFVPLEVLDNPGKLSPENHELVKKHPSNGADFLKRHGCLPRATIETTRSHHELLDGSGYPDGLSGSQISPLVRIMTISDVYSALIERRAYKEAYSPRQALSIMWEMKGKLDPILLKEFSKSVCHAKMGRVASRPERVG